MLAALNQGSTAMAGPFSAATTVDAAIMWLVSLPGQNRFPKDAATHADNVPISASDLESSYQGLDGISLGTSV
jgi:hypothetical protein